MAKQIVDDELSMNHWTLNCYRQVVSLKSYKAILHRYGSHVFRNGTRPAIKGKKIGPGMYEVWLEEEDS